MNAHPHVHVHEADILGDLPDEFVRQFADEWTAAEERIKRENDLKASMLKKVSTLHGRPAADALKAAMHLLKQDPSKRVQRDHIGRIARRFVAVIEGTAFKSRFDH